MIRNLRKLLQDFIPNPSFLKKPVPSYADSQNPALYRMEAAAFPHFDYESPENLTRYTNISLVHSKDINTFLEGIDTFIFDCDGVIVKIFEFLN